MSQAAVSAPAVPGADNGDAAAAVPRGGTVVVETLAAFAVGLVVLFPLYAVLFDVESALPSNGASGGVRTVAGQVAPVAALVVSAALSLVLPARLRGWPGVFAGLLVAAATMVVAAHLADQPSVWAADYRPAYQLCHAAAGGLVLGSCLVAVLHPAPLRSVPWRAAPAAGLAAGIAAAAAFWPVEFLVRHIWSWEVTTAAMRGWPYWRLGAASDRPVPALVTAALVLSVAAAVVTRSRVPSRSSGRVVAVVCGVGVAASAVLAAVMTTVDWHDRWQVNVSVGRQAAVIGIVGGAIVVAVAVLTWTARRLDGPGAGRWALVVCGGQLLVAAANPLSAAPWRAIGWALIARLESSGERHAALNLSIVATLATPVTLTAVGALAGALLARRRPAVAWEAAGLAVMALAFAVPLFLSDLAAIRPPTAVALGAVALATGFTVAAALSRTSAAGAVLGLAGACAVAPLFWVLDFAVMATLPLFVVVPALSGVAIAAAVAAMAWRDRPSRPLRMAAQ